MAPEGATATRWAPRCQMPVHEPRQEWLSEGFHDGVDGSRNLTVLFSQGIDFANGMKDSRVVLAAEIFANLRQGLAGEFFADVHGNLSRHCDRS
jgi:hypothetical protein